MMATTRYPSDRSFLAPPWARSADPGPMAQKRRRHQMLDTGFPRADAENDFLRARRRQVLATLARRLRRQPPGSDRLLRLDDVTGALGWRGERRLGLQTIRLDTIAGTVGSGRDFDRRFRPASGRVRERWEQLALAERRGAAIPPIEVYRVGGLHFVSDGHHRVSIAAATGRQAIDAYVTEIFTAVPPAGTMRRGRPGLPVQNPQRPFRRFRRRRRPAYGLIEARGKVTHAWHAPPKTSTSLTRPPIGPIA